MPNKNYLRGRAKEYEAKKILEDAGYTVMRTAGSHGPADLIVNDSEHVFFIQLKRFAAKATALQKQRIIDEAVIKFTDANIPPYIIKVVLIYVDRKGWETEFIFDDKKLTPAQFQFSLPKDDLPFNKKGKDGKTRKTKEET